jgi:hypothetical protein
MYTDVQGLVRPKMLYYFIFEQFTGTIPSVITFGNVYFCDLAARVAFFCGANSASAASKSDRLLGVPSSHLHYRNPSFSSVAKS